MQKIALLTVHFDCLYWNCEVLLIFWFVTHDLFQRGIGAVRKKENKKSLSLSGLQDPNLIRKWTQNVVLLEQEKQFISPKTRIFIQRGSSVDQKVLHVSFCTYVNVKEWVGTRTRIVHCFTRWLIVQKECMASLSFFSMSVYTTSKRSKQAIQKTFIQRDRYFIKT